jgi:hypothetical protein
MRSSMSVHADHDSDGRACPVHGASFCLGPGQSCTGYTGPRGFYVQGVYGRGIRHDGKSCPSQGRGTGTDLGSQDEDDHERHLHRMLSGVRICSGEERFQADGSVTALRPAAAEAFVVRFRIVSKLVSGIRAVRPEGASVRQAPAAARR